MQNFFDKMVVSENDCTNLLCNVMERNTKVAASVLTYLLGKPVSEEIVAKPCRYDTQRRFESEIPDLCIESTDIFLLVEVKVDPALGLTPQQLKGYPLSLGGREGGKLIILVPDNWIYTQRLPPRAEVRYWSELLRICPTDVADLSPGDIVHEAITFLKARFQVNPLLKGERELVSANPVVTFSAIRKLEHNIDQSRKIFDSRYDKALSPRTIPSITDNEYGFYVLHSKLYLLWVGMWTESNAILSYGFDLKSEWARNFSGLTPDAKSAIEDGHRLWALEPETWDRPDLIVDRISTFLDHHYTGMPKRSQAE